MVMPDIDDSGRTLESLNFPGSLPRDADGENWA